MTTAVGPWLVLDTSTPLAVVGIVRGGRALSQHRVSEPRRHAEGLMDAIDGALLAASVSLDEIVGVGVGVGPGSFIGIRTGIATAKGLCLGRALPLVGLPTLLAIACSAELPQGKGLVVVDAKRGEVYAQLVEATAAGAVGRVSALLPPVALAPEQARTRAVSLAFIVGSALGDAPEGTAGIAVASPSAEGLARVLDDVIARGVFDHLATLAPEYCRAPDARPSSDMQRVIKGR